MENKELNNKVSEKFKTKIAISNFQKEERLEKKSKYNILKFVATFVLTLGVSVGMVYAGGVIYEKIFTKPEKIENYIEELKVDEEDLKSIISKEQAINIAKEDVKKYGLELKEEEIVETKLQKAPNYDEISYIIKTNNLQISINATEGKFRSFWLDDNYSTEEIEKMTSSKEEIIKVAKEKLKEYGISDEYKLSYISSNISDDEEKSYLWYLWFSKQYDGLFNETQSISMTIIPKVNQVISFSITDEPFDNNEIVITEEEAINIAKEKDKVINTKNYIVSSVEAELAIKRVNPEVYLKENGLTNGNETVTLEDGTTYSYNAYKMNGRARKVYVVTISYEDRPFDQKRKYFVDCTTGEVIGGEDIFDLDEIKN